MQREQDNPRAIHDVLLGLPAQDRLVALMCAIIEGDLETCEMAMVSVAGIMSRQRTPAQRLAFIWHMLEEIERTNAKWN